MCWRLFSKCQRQFYHFESSTVARFWVESCSPYHLFSLKSVEFWLLSGLWGNVRPWPLERKDFGELLCSVTLTWDGLFWFEKGACLWERLQFLAETQTWSFANALGQCIFFAERSSLGEGWAGFRVRCMSCGWILVHA